MKVEISIRNVYGRELIYPVNDTAKKLAELIGHVTFTPKQLKIIHLLGFEIVQVPSDSIKEFLK